MGDLKTKLEDFSCSRSINETVSGSHQFIIEGYSLLKGLAAGQSISSDIFRVGGYDWAIYFYPYGKHEISTSVSVFITLAGNGANVSALLEFTLVDPRDTDHHYKVQVGPRTFKRRGDVCGCERFITRSVLEQLGYIKNDRLIINCKIRLPISRIEGSNQNPVWVGCSSTMDERFFKLLLSETGCDIVFHVGDERLKAHKLVMAASSPVFRAQFYGDVGDPNMKKVVVKEIDPLVFKGMLFFIYTNRLPYEITGNVVPHLLAAADMYGLDGLKLVCESKLCEEVSAETAATMLALADRYHCSKLKAFCLKFAAKPGNLGAIIKSEGYKHLEENCPSLLTEILNTIASGDYDSSGKRKSRWC